MVGYSEASGNMGANRYGDNAEESAAPAARFGSVIDPNAADVDFAIPARALYIGVAGNITVVGVDGTSTLFTGLLAGTILPVQCIGTLATSSSSTNAIPLY